MRGFAILACIGLISWGLGCSNRQDNPDVARQKAAENTAKLKQETKAATQELRQETKAAGQDLRAMAQGAREGWSADKNAVDINNAGKEQLLSLPGINDRLARRIIAARPYRDPHEMVSKGVISEEEYRQIQSRVVAK